MSVNFPEKQSSSDSSSIVTVDDESMEDLDKRAHVFRYGKRAPSVFRYGKRAPSVFRYGKRGSSVFRYGKRFPSYDLEDATIEVFPKRIFRYGKRSGDELSATEEEIFDDMHGDDKRKIFRYGKRSIGDEEKEEIKQKHRLIVENSAEEEDDLEKEVELVHKRPAIFRYGR